MYFLAFVHFVGVARGRKRVEEKEAELELVQDLKHMEKRCITDVSTANGNIPLLLNDDHSLPEGWMDISS